MAKNMPPHSAQGCSGLTCEPRDRHKPAYEVVCLGIEVHSFGVVPPAVSIGAGASPIVLDVQQARSMLGVVSLTIRTAFFWSLAALACVSPLIIAVVVIDPLWYQNVPFILIVLIPGVGGGLALGPAWYYRRRKLLKQEFRVSGPASEHR